MDVLHKNLLLDYTNRCMQKLTKEQKEELRYHPKTSIQQVVEANSRLYRATGLVVKCRASEVEAVMHFVGNFVADTMRAGRFQAVMLPYFGKFKPKQKHLKALTLTMAERKNSLDLFKRAMSGKKLIRFDPDIITIYPLNYSPDETIRDNGRQDGSAEQGMDIPDSRICSTDQEG